jgi:hypothetical protein
MFETDSERHPSPMELSLETPIFHALTAGLSTAVSMVVRSEPDELIEFHRDPLLAPIPIQAYTEPTIPAAQPATGGSSDGSALSMMTPWLEHAVLDPANEYGRHHRPVPAVPCAYRW